MSVTDGPGVAPASASLAHSWVGPAAGDVTLVLHGGGPGCHSVSDFGAVLAACPARRWLCLDLPAYGSSPSRAELTEADGREPTLAEAVERTLRGLGLEKVDVLAQSLGGIVALELAARRPELIDRIALIGSQPTPSPGAARSLSRRPELGASAREEYYGGSGPSPAKMRALIAGLEWWDAAAIPDSTVLARHRASTTPIALAQAQDSARPPVADIGELLHCVAAPTLVMWGRHDPFGGPDYAGALADTLARGDLAVIGRTAHHPQAERPGVVAALSDAFLKGDG